MPTALTALLYSLSVVACILVAGLGPVIEHLALGLRQHSLLAPLGNTLGIVMACWYQML